MKQLLAGVVLGISLSSGVALAQAMTASSAPPAGDPLNALWSFLGSSSVAGVLYLWARSEQTDRREASRKLVELVEADVEHKAQIRERLKGQDELIARVLEVVGRIERSLQPAPRGPGRLGG